MKKLSFLLIALLAVTLFTSCNKDDDNVNKQTFGDTLYSRTIDGNNVGFSQSAVKVELDLNNRLVSITWEYKDSHQQSRIMSAYNMKLQLSSGNVYKFNDATATAIGFEQLEGYFDFDTYMISFKYMVDGKQVYSTTNLAYVYVQTEILNPENNNQGEHEKSAYVFIPDATGETCEMRIFNFTPNVSGTVEAAEIQYKNLKLTPTTTGYVITADEAESSYKGFYTITDLHIILDDQCRTLAGTFECNDLVFTIQGRTFQAR